ncbi:hypothetical protein BDD12DRAFT_804470 [Trichophaea hybrida]|nr:hypothetical protein BDD12DRAFT_804470 [Trichophaea hybrida]
MVDTESGGQKDNLLIQLREGSEFLDSQREDLMGIWEGFKRKIVSFYETKETPSVRQVGLSEFRRDGPEVQMVQRFSVLLHLPAEHRVPVDENHTNMVKFDSPVDRTYLTVVKHLKRCLGTAQVMGNGPSACPTGSCGHYCRSLYTFRGGIDLIECKFEADIVKDSFLEEKDLRSAIDNVNPVQFLRRLRIVDQEKYKSTMPSWEQHKFNWIFENIEFKLWRSTGSHILWLSGPPTCRIRDAVSHCGSSGDSSKGNFRISGYPLALNLLPNCG